MQDSTFGTSGKGKKFLITAVENESRSCREQFIDRRVHFVKFRAKRRRIPIWRIRIS